MSADALKTALTRRPFAPIRVVLSSGDGYEIRHPEFAWLVKGGLYVGLPADVPTEDGGELPERAVFCSMLHIAAIENLTAA